MSDLNIENVQNIKKKKIEDPNVKKNAEEWIRCQTNPLYFIYNYVYIPETGGKVKLMPNNLHPKMKRVVRTIYNYHNAILMASRQLGKALDLETPVPLYEGGYRRVGDLNRGDIIFDEDGNPTKILETTEVMYNRPCYRITFDNDETIIADEEHEWKISNSSKNINDEIITTRRLYGIENEIKKLSSAASCRIKFHNGNKTKNFYIKDIEPVESVPVKCIQVDNWKGMFLAGKDMVPTHNSTIAACLITWASIFFPRNRAVILNMKKDAALNNIEIIRYIINNLPAWMVTSRPFKQKGEIKTYIDLFNESKIQVFYPSTQHKPETLARSLTSPILYVDEAAYIKSMHEIYGSAQQTLSRAREQAKRNNYPYMTLITSTPNGTHGIGKWFFDRWEGAADSDYLFKLINDWEEKWSDEVDINACVNDPSKNTFTRIKYHWSEDPDKTEDWYKDQCRDLNDQRLINQELDLIFVGTQDCIFDDDTLAKFESRTPVTKINTPHFSNLEVYEPNPSPGDYYLIGCDTAESLTGAYCAIEIFSFKDFNQIAELKDRFGSYTAFANAIDFTFQWLRNLVGENIILCVENNTIGR